MTTIHDDFNGADHSSLGLTSDGNGTWSVLNGTWERLSNQAHTSASSGAGSVAYIDCGSNDGTIEATLATNQVGICFRIVDINHFYVAYGTFGDVWRCDGGFFTSLGSYGSTPSAGVPLQVVLTGSQIQVFQSSSLIFSTTDATYSSTKHGIFGQRTFSSDLINDWTYTSPVASGRGWVVGAVTLN